MADGDSPESTRKPLFDLGDSAGVTVSERILTRLCQRSFLRLWSQSNVFTDEGFKNGKGSAKELCDALVVFGNDVIIFSDKHVKFQSDRALDVAWPRWYRRAVLESCKQLHGARSWLERFPGRAFLDPRCTRTVPIAVPVGAEVRFHLVAVTRGSRDAAIAAMGGAGLGSFAINTALEGDTHLKAPFHIGLPEPRRPFVHVFDEVTIELLVSEFDTAVDFLDYLRSREAFIGRRGTHIYAPGEEELIAAYLLNMDNAGTRHVFVNLPEGEQPDVMMFDGTHFARLQGAPEYQRKKRADQVSYVWDALIDRFLKHGSPDLPGTLLEQTSADIERGLRLLAAESRFRRRQLAEALRGAMARVEAGGRLTRLVDVGTAGETVYVFLISAKRDDESYDEYKLHRTAVLHAYVRTARLQARLGKAFVGLAFDNPHKSYAGFSEDMIVLLQDEWSDAQLSDLEQKRKELGLWRSDVEYSRYRQDEFPQADQSVPIKRMATPKPTDLPEPRVVAGIARKARKRREKMQQKPNRRSRR